MIPRRKIRLVSGPRAGVGRKRTPARTRATVEVLEGRALLSHLHAAAHHRPATAQVEVDPTLVGPPPFTPHPGPILSEHGVGFVVKSPRFYPYFTGTKRGELNAAGAKAFLDGQGNAVLIGIVAGTVIATPDTADKSEFYVFGVDRGLTPGPGPFPGRPLIKFDAVVVVSITPDGTTGYARDLSTGVQTPLTSDQIAVGNDNIRVTVPTGLFIPPGATPTVRPTVNFWPIAVAPPGNYTDVTSFASEFRNFPLSLGPLVHHGRH